MRLTLIGICVIALSCREIQPVETVRSIHGYELDGTVLAPDGSTVDSATVRLYFELDPVGSTPIDTQSVRVTGPNQIVNVSIYTPHSEYVRTLFSGTMAPGTVPRYPWDGIDAFGSPVPSGKYLMRYTVDATIVKSSTVVVTGHLTAVSDRKGQFILAGDQLPIGEVYDFYTSSNDYDATVTVRSEVGIVLQKSGLPTSSRAVVLTKDRVTVATFTME